TQQPTSHNSARLKRRERGRWIARTRAGTGVKPNSVSRAGGVVGPVGSVIVPSVPRWAIPHAAVRGGVGWVRRKLGPRTHRGKGRGRARHGTGTAALSRRPSPPAPP